MPGVGPPLIATAADRNDRSLPLAERILALALSDLPSGGVRPSPIRRRHDPKMGAGPPAPSSILGCERGESLEMQGVIDFPCLR
jgi:hypothetical protein